MNVEAATARYIDGLGAANLEKAAAYYDPKCLACHLTKPSDAKTVRRNADACPVSTKQCVTCHMPKVELSGMHASFTDHWIRVVRRE